MSRRAASALLAVWSLTGCTSGGVDRCAANQEQEGSRCVAVCDDDERVLPNGRCEPICDTGEEAVDGECFPLCPVGQERVNGQCVAECGGDEQRIEGTCTAPSDVRVNGIGYALDANKLAVISSVPEETEDAELRRADDESVVLTVPLTGPRDDETSGLELWIADFSEWTEPGRYFVHVEGVGDSARFEIARDPYAVALEASMLGFYGLRCGTEVRLEHEDEVFAHEACHLDDALLDVGSDQVVPSLGGWHDAGDYGKYSQNGAFAAGILLLAWEHFRDRLIEFELDQLPEHGGGLPDYLDEVKWELDWLLTMQQPNGAVYHKLTALGFEPFLMPEADNAARYFVEPSTEATGSFAAVMAMAARLYEEYDTEFAQRCLEAAEASYEFLEDNPTRIPSDPERQFSTGAYASDDRDDRLWAAAELWLTTGRADVLSDFSERAASPQVRDDWDWGDLSNLAYFSFVTGERDGKPSELTETLEAAIVASADRLVSGAEQDGFGRALEDTYYWGANGLVVRSILNLAVAYQLSAEPAYQAAALRQLDHMFGVNVHSRSMVTGLGHLPPLFPHHRPSGADGIDPPWPGLLTGGPNPQTPPDAPGGVVDDPGAPAPYLWQDDQASYWTNEVAVNWNAPLVYGLAWLSASNSN